MKESFENVFFFKYSLMKNFTFHVEKTFRLKEFNLGDTKMFYL